MNKYWQVMHTPDTTETGFCMCKTYIKTEWKGFPAQQYQEKEIVEDFCYKKFGSKVAYVQGVAPTLAWCVTQISESDYDTGEPFTRWGYSSKKIVLEIGYRGQTVVISEE
jgi:hypothetical protein